MEGLNRLTAGTLYHSGQLVLNKDCLSHVRKKIQDKKKKLYCALEKHKQDYFKKKEVIQGILEKYNSNNHCNFGNWRDMDMSKIGITNQKKILSWLRRKGDSSIPVDANSILLRLRHQILNKEDPSLVEYLLSKGKTREEVATFLQIPLENLDVFDEKNIERKDAAETLLSLNRNIDNSNQDNAANHASGTV